MKKILFIMLLLHNLFALDDMSVLPKPQKELIEKIITNLNLPSNQNTKKMIFNKINFVFKDGWSAHWTTNDTPANSKIENSNTQIFDLNVYNNNRVINITFIYFKKEKQLFLSIKQYVETNSKQVLNLYKKRKKDDKYTLENETDNYAYFHEKGYMSYEVYHIKPSAGMVVYEDTLLLNIK